MRLGCSLLARLRGTSSAYILLDPLVSLRISPGGPNDQGVHYLTRGSKICHYSNQGVCRAFFFTQNLPFLDPLVTTGFAGGIFLTQNQPFLDPLVVLSRTGFYFLPIAGGEIRLCDWFVVFLNSKF